MRKKERIRDKFHAHRFFFLLLALFSLFFVFPFVEDSSYGPSLTLLILTAIPVAGVYSVSEKQRELIPAVIFAVPVLVSTWLQSLFPHPALFNITALLGTIFYVYTIFMILFSIKRAKKIDLNLIFGAIAVYLLIGLMWSVFFLTAERMHPGSFLLLNPGVFDFSVSVYYSFVTITTLGYGDILPLTAQARSLSILEAIFGIFYIAVMIARLVGIHIITSLKVTRRAH